jgi:hypothetical protein
MRNILLLLGFILGAPAFPVVFGVLVGATVLLQPQPVPAQQQIRQLPANGKRGTTGDLLPLPQVVINRETLTLAPGGLIFDTNNRTILHQSLPPGSDVWFQLNNIGQIQRIYILRPEEQARLDSEKKFFFF